MCLNLTRVTKKDVKKLLLNNDEITIYLGTYKNGICFGTPKREVIKSIEEIDIKKKEANISGWKGKLDIFIKD